jgi:hypothetical protein
LTYTIQSNSNSSLFAAMPSISAGDVLSLLGDVDANGVATLVIRATDSGSLYCEYNVVVGMNHSTATAPQVYISTLQHGEEGGQDASFTLKRVADDISESLTVYFTLSGTASSSTDYTPSSSVTFAADSDTAVVTLPITDDSTPEETETISLSIDDSTADPPLYVPDFNTSGTVPVYDTDSSVSPPQN